MLAPTEVTRRLLDKEPHNQTKYKRKTPINPPRPKNAQPLRKFKVLPLRNIRCLIPIFHRESSDNLGSILNF